MIWTLWHLPLFLTGLIPWPDAAVVFALTFVFTAVYLRTAGSVLIAFLLHAAINGAGAFFVGLFTGDDRVRMYWIMAALCAVVAIAAIVAGRDRWRRVPAIGDHDDATASAGSVPRKESLMPSSGLSSSAVKRGGVAGVLAAALFVLSTILAQIAPTGLTYESATDYLHEILLVGAFGATMVAILGLHALHRSHPRYGPVGVIGTVLAVTGYGIVTLVLAVSMAVGGRALTEVRIAGAVTLLVGSALLGVATLRARLVPWWCGLLLIIAFPLGDVANQVFGGAEGLLLALLWGSVGAALLSRAGSLTQAVGPQPPAAALNRIQT